MLQVRWVASKTRALRAIHSNMYLVVAHLEEMTSSKAESNKASHYHKEICSVRFLKMLAIMTDILEVLSDLSQFFQRNDLLLIDVAPALECAMLKLQGLKYSPGPSMKKFGTSYSVEKKSYTVGEESLQLTGQCPIINILKDTVFLDLVNGIIKYMDKRFSSFYAGPSHMFSRVFDFTLWPETTNIEELAEHGTNEVTELMEHYGALFTTEDSEKAVQQYHMFKAFVSRRRDCKPLAVFTIFLATRESDMDVIAKLLEIMMVMSCSTAKAERVFSQTNIIKTKLRSCLNQDILRDLLLIQMEGPARQDFNPSDAIAHWLTSGSGTRHIFSAP